MNGWGGYVLKEMLKLIKGILKIWHQTHAENMDRRLKEVKDRILELDTKGGEHAQNLFSKIKHLK